MFVKACQIFGRSSISKGAGLLWGYHHVSGIPVTGRLYGSHCINGRLYGSHCINGRLCGSHHTSDIPVRSAFCGNHQIQGIPIKYGYLFLNIRCLHQKQLNTDYWHAFQLINIPVRNFSITPYLCKVSDIRYKKSKEDKSKSVKIQVTPGIGSSDLEHKMKKIQSALQKGKTVKIYFYRFMKTAKTQPATENSIRQV